MRKSKSYSKIFNNTAWFMALLLIVLTAGCDRDHGAGVTPAPGGPSVIYTIPADGATGVLLNRKITAAFSEPMSIPTITTATFAVTGRGTSVTGTVALDSTGRIAVLTPAVNLTAGTTYTGTITIGAKNVAGTALANNFVWAFTTGTTSDTTPPLLNVTTPANSATNVPVNQVITATFDEPMDPLTISATSFHVTGPSGTVTGDVTFAGTTASFKPVVGLASGATYTAVIAASDLAGNAWLSGNVPNPWSFTTGTTGAIVHLGPEPVILGSAGNFNILAGSAVSNTDTLSAPTTINGLVGVFPGSAVSGLPNTPPAVGGVTVSQIHAGDTVAEVAKVDLLAAYNDAQSLSVNAISLPGNMGGLTLAPGLYVNSTSSGISGTGPNGILTLDAQGDANAVWIFKMGSTLITDSGTSIVLAGNAQARNIFWQVGSSATLGTNSIFKGNILAQISITLTTGVNLQGRALTATGAVTLDTNTITLP